VDLVFPKKHPPRPLEREKHGHASLIVRVLLTELHLKLAFLQNRAQHEISADDQVGQNGCQVQGSRPDNEHAATVPRVADNGQRATGVQGAV